MNLKLHKKLQKKNNNNNKKMIKKGQNFLYRNIYIENDENI